MRTTNRCVALVFTLVLCAGAIGCSKGGRSTGGSGGATAEAKQVYDAKCASCHGATGRGDGMAATSLPVKPRNYSDKDWQSKTDDAKITKAIIEGGPAVGLNPTMPPSPELKTKPEVVKELVKLIRNFAN